MAFRFSYETLLSMKRNLEELSQMRLAEKQRRLQEKTSEIKQLSEQIASTRGEFRRKLETGLSANEYVIYKEYEEQCLQILEQKEKERQYLLAEIEREQEVLLKLMKERKIFERLKERLFQRYRYQLERMDQKAIDEMIVVRHHENRET